MKPAGSHHPYCTAIHYYLPLIVKYRNVRLHLGMSEMERDLTVREVAARMGTHTETIRRWLRRGMFPNAYQISNRYGWRIPEGDLDALRRRTRMQAGGSSLEGADGYERR